MESKLKYISNINDKVSSTWRIFVKIKILFLLNLSAITPANKTNINCGSVAKSTVKEINNGSRVISEKSQGYAKPVIPSAKLLNT